MPYRLRIELGWGRTDCYGSIGKEPAHRLLGSYAIDLVRLQLSLLAEEIDRREAVTRPIGD